MARVRGSVVRKRGDRVQVEFGRDEIEAFCNVVGLFRSGFLKALSSSEDDHRTGRVRSRRSLLSILRTA